MQNSFQSNITDIAHIYNITWFIYYIIQRIVIRISEYKPLGIKETKRKVETISSLLGKHHPHESYPQAARSVARAILHIFFICRPVDSFARILHLSGYPQGRDKFTSPSICKLYVDADGIKEMPRIGYVFLCKQYMYCHPNTFHHGQLRQPGLPVFYLPLQLSQPWVGAGTPSPRTSAAIQAGKVD